jgi:hypothetical protein
MRGAECMTPLIISHRSSTRQEEPGTTVDAPLGTDVANPIITRTPPLLVPVRRVSLRSAASYLRR